MLLHNEGPDSTGVLQFTDIALGLGVDGLQSARGYAATDFDNDGDLDLAINHNPGDTLRQVPVRPTLLRNEIGSSRSWLAIELRGTKSNRDGVGATVTIETGTRKQTRLMSIGAGYASQNTNRLYVGLNQATQVDRLTVRWPAGGKDQFENIQSMQRVRITEGKGLERLPLPTAMHLSNR